MAKLLLILLIGLFFEAAGVVFLSKGLKQLPSMPELSLAAAGRIVLQGATNKSIILGIFFEAIFFAGLLVLMSRTDVSFLWPMTALSFVFTTIAARYVLHEQVPFARWMGVLLIMLGAALITWTEKSKIPIPPGGLTQLE
jgi:drug/metabolite transporter (DMT)-like permease